MSTAQSDDDGHLGATGAVLVLCSFPQDGEPEAVARALLEQNLAGSINILPAGHSLFHWEGRVQSAAEHQLLIKTVAAAYASVESVIREHHPYELPSILCVPIATGYAPYLQWVKAMVRTSA